MAEIPVEKKSSKGWLWLLLALLVIALLLWALLSNDDDETVIADEAAVVAVDDDATMAGDGAAAMTAGLAGYTIGESIDLDNLRVTSLAGDMAFNADVNGENVLVLFNQEPTPGDPTEGEYDINPGSTVNITGSVRDASEGVPDNVDAEIPAGTERYIFADTIEMVE